MPYHITCLDLAQHAKLLCLKKRPLLISLLKQMNISHGFNRSGLMEVG